MPSWPRLVVVTLVGLLVAVLFAFTLTGLVAEVVAPLALITEAVLAVARRAGAHRDS
jgi:nitrate/nitrite-specific signal transduction histidine kinase